MMETPRKLGAGEAAEAAVALSPHIQPWHAEHFPEMFHPEPDAAGLKLFFEGGMEGPTFFAFGIGEPVGALLFGLIQMREETALHKARRILMIEQIVVAPEMRRQGAARALFEAALAHGREEGCNEAALTTYEGNAGAHAFFRSMGFAPRVQAWAAPL
ncbi:GNAT family N-acetyltransferase [Pseudoroseicyclus sp. H15]